MFNTWGMREMIAGMVLVSAVVGMAAVATTLALSLPTWAVVMTYPVVCSLTLLLAAALWSIRSRQSVHAEQALRT
jgi:membrane protein implicated in regulation of membrane protease activity